jgi:Lar family restriction alleviation protein
MKQSTDREPVTEIINLQLEPTDKLLPCPFCGGTEMVLENTHSPSYWIECPCGAEMHAGGVKWKTEAGKNSMANHKKAKQMTIDAWNKRTPSKQVRPRFVYGHITNDTNY